MKLGVMVTTDRYPDQISGITRAALGKGHTVAIFATDAGTGLLADRRFSALAALTGVTMNYCAHSALQHGGRPDGLPGTIAEGSQFENAIMVTESDKVIVL